MDPKKYPWYTDDEHRERARYEDYETACEMALSNDERNRDAISAFDVSQYH